MPMIQIVDNVLIQNTAMLKSTLLHKISDDVSDCPKTKMYTEQNMTALRSADVLASDQTVIRLRYTDVLTADTCGKC
jgi:hypothetical protein